MPSHATTRLARVSLTAAALAATAWTGAVTASAAAETGAAIQQPADDAKGRDLVRTPELLKKYELDKDGLAIDGYDPVAYFPEGDPKGNGDAIKGKRGITHTHAGVTYRFISTRNRDLFKDNPRKYEPAFGGWCAYAMANEQYTEPSPKNWKVQDGRLFLFYKDFFTNTQKAWEKEGPKQLEPKADRYWKAETGEEPRRPSDA